MTWEHSETIAAMILEPIITGGGVIMPPDDYLKGVKEVCEKHGALLIVDEVICGFGRTGKAFGHQHYGVQPDIITMAKGLTSAYMPLSATAVKREVYEEFTKSEVLELPPYQYIWRLSGGMCSCIKKLRNYGT